MKLKIVDYNTKAAISNWAEKFNLKMDEVCEELIIKIPDSMGDAYLHFIDLSDGIELALLNGHLSRNIEINISCEKNQPLVFKYCLEGSLDHSMYEEFINYAMNPLQYSLTKNSDKCSQEILFNKGVNQKFFAIIIDTQVYNDKMECELKEAPSYISNLFGKEKKAGPYFKSGSYNLKIAEIINNIFNNADTDIIRRNAIEGYTYQLIAEQLKNFKIQDGNFEKTILTNKSDVEHIISAKDILIEDIKDAPTIVELAKKVGINQQKLKRGFKEIFGTTINRYLRNHRLEEARLLILGGVDSLMEVSEKIGYSNPSHFAKRFREKFGVLPKDYRKSIRNKSGIPGSSSEQ